jgi:hypothetical protein
VWNQVGHLPYNVNFSSRNRLFILCRQLPYCYCVGNVSTNTPPPPHAQHIYKNNNYEIFNSFTWNRCLKESIPRRNLFLTRIDYVKSMPGVLKKVKIQTLSYRYKSKILTYKKSGLTVAALYRKCIWRRARGRGGVSGGRARG